MRVLGIDPGLAIVGFGVVDGDNAGYSAVDYGAILTDKELKIEERLMLIADDVSQLLSTFNPQAVAIEEIFFSKNVSTAVSVSQARGVIVLEVSRAQIPIFHYNPMQVKQALTSYGGASKDQVQEMVTRLLDLPEVPKPDDTADALAIALSHVHTNCV